MPPPVDSTEALTETQKRRRDNLQQQYGEGKLEVLIDSIHPKGGPTTGMTRVLVRGGPFEDMHLVYPHPKCKFGRRDMIVDAQYVSCTQKPLTVEDIEGKHAVRDHHCLQCEASPLSDKAELVSLLVSLTGDFSDTADSATYRYYLPPEVHAIYPRYGIKDGGTLVEVWGKNFLNFDYNTRCGFGSKTTQADFKTDTYMTCKAPISEVVKKPIPFSISLNGQQNTEENVFYWYYNRPIVTELQPNYGLDQGGNQVMIKGSNFHPFDWENDINNQNDTFCYFEQEEIKMPMRVVNSTKAYCEAPPNVMHLDSTYVEVTLNNRDFSDDEVPYFYYRPSKITNIEPKEGPTRGNTTVMVFGIDFTPGKKIICKFGEIKTRGKFVSIGQIKCLSPPSPQAGNVPVAIAYEGEDSKFQSESFDFLYYETPILESIEPTCGPVTGYTQIKVKGKNFMDMGFGKVKCLFNGTHMNATIVDDNTIYCDSPRLNDDQVALETPFLKSLVQVTLNGRETTLEQLEFNYYPELKITMVQKNVGPLSGGTTSYIQGEGFTHPHVCNPMLRYGAIEVKPKLKQATFVSDSPRVSAPGSVTIFPSGNGQNFAPDYTLHFRDVENTFTYIQDVFLQDLEPESGPSTGGTKVVVRGHGFQPFKFDNGTTNLVTPSIRMIDQYGKQWGNVSEVTDATNTHFTYYTPAAPPGSKCTMIMSYNNQDWQPLVENGKQYSFLYYSAPSIVSITPRYGPVKVSVPATINGKNFECPDAACANLLVRFGLENQGTIVPGTLLSSSQIQIQVPAYTKPDVLPIEISFNGVDFTNSNLTYGYFDPFVIRVSPKLISMSKSAKLTVHGFGFINPDNTNELKVKFTSPNGELTCAGVNPCVVPGTYIDKNTIECDSLLMASLSYPDGSSVKVGDPIWVEVTLVGDIYTDNKIAVFYHKNPSYGKVSRDSVPSNLDQPILIDTEFQWDVNSLDQFNEHSNFTCLFQVGDESIVTQGRMETVPFGAQYDSESTVPTHVACSTPDMHNSGKGTLKISPNGQDYTGAIDYEFQIALDLYRVLPQCGPQEGSNKVKLMGNGFNAQKDAVYSKFGVLAVQVLEKSAVQQMAWNFQGYLDAQEMSVNDLHTFEAKNHKIQEGQVLSTIVVEAPKPKDIKLGGPVYVSVGQHISLNQVTEDGKNVSNTQYFYENSLVEYYYYKSPIVKKVEPTSGLTSGGTPLEISGAWFDIKLQYGLVPHCKIGDKIVRASFHSTVRLICNSPPNDNIYAALPVKVSLNGVDWVETGHFYSYYKQSTLKEIFPRSGQMNGGTEVFVIGENFSNITNPDNSRCRWTLIDNMSGQKRDRVIQFTPAYYINETQMMCVTPSSFIGGDRAFLQITFNNLDYSAQDENFVFQFYSIQGAFPHSGPSNAQNEVILIKGAGFKPTSKIYCSLNKTEQLAVEISENLVKCPMSWPGKDPKATGLVKFGMSMDGSWTDFGSFYFYQQIELDDVFPRFGPSEGHGIIYLYGARFRDDFPNSELGCKVGESIGQGQLIDQTTIRCVVEHMDLVNIGESLPVQIALNSYSWVGERANHRELSTGLPGYVPYGIQSIFPESGIIEGYTDIFVTGKGFTDDIADKAKCRFGVDGSYHMVDAEVIDYTKLVCRSPPSETEDYESVPFSISFGEQEYKPWTQDLHRFRYYAQPWLGYAVPDEINIRKKTEIYVFAASGYTFNQPVPTGQLGMSDYHGTGGVSCSFGDFGTSMGMYINQTTMLCLTPHIAGTSDDYSTETVTVGIAMNGQDFMEETSYAKVTFVGTGSGPGFFHFVITALLIALLLLAIFTCVTALMGSMAVEKKTQPGVITLRDSSGLGSSQPRSYNPNNNRSYNGSRQQNSLAGRFSGQI